MHNNDKPSSRVRGPVHFPIMNPLTFKDIRSTTRGYVAVFEDFGREFLLDEESLEMRIANLERTLERTLDVSVERAALASLRQCILANKLSSPAQ